jgi:DNA adenine methylase
MLKPFLKWAGSKRKIVNLIKEKSGEIKGNFIEPFVGSGTVFLNVYAEHYILSDLNSDLINLYKVLQSDGLDFIKYTKTYFGKFNTEEDFYRIRGEFNSMSDTYIRSALFIYLNRHSFNGLCRYNKDGKFNVPYGKYKSVYFPEKELTGFSNRIYNCNFIAQDFRKTLLELKEDDVVYCDPPYTPISETSSFTTYCADGFSNQDQIDLVSVAEKSPCRFIISNNLTEFTSEIYKNADELIDIDVQKTISSKNEGRKKTKEIIAIYN